MPPKPRPIFKTPSSSSQKDATPTSNTSSMPPPPDPPQPQGILVPEVTALNDCLTVCFDASHAIEIQQVTPSPDRMLL